MLKLFDKLCWIVAAFIWATLIYAAITSSAGAATPPTPVCAHEEDVYDVVVANLNHHPVWTTKVKQGKCAYVRWPLTYFHDIETFPENVAIAQYILTGTKAVLFGVVRNNPHNLIEVTYKTEFANHSMALRWWFQNAKPTKEFIKDYTKAG